MSKSCKDIERKLRLDKLHNLHTIEDKPILNRKVEWNISTHANTQQRMTELISLKIVI